jgi:hypothetical protein
MRVFTPEQVGSSVRRSGRRFGSARSQAFHARRGDASSGVLRSDDPEAPRDGVPCWPEAHAGASRRVGIHSENDAVIHHREIPAKSVQVCDDWACPHARPRGRQPAASARAAREPAGLMSTAADDIIVHAEARLLAGGDHGITEGCVTHVTTSLPEARTLAHPAPEAAVVLRYRYQSIQ